MRLVLRFYSPYDGGFTDVRVNNKPQTVYADRHMGRNVTRVILEVKPGRELRGDDRDDLRTQPARRVDLLHDPGIRQHAQRRGHPVGVRLSQSVT